MPHTITLPDVKTYAKRLTAYVNMLGCKIKHAQSLDAIAVMLGYRNYNTLRAILNDAPRELLPTSVVPGYVDFLNATFEINHQPGQTNPQSLFFPGYSEGHLNLIESGIRKALSEIGRPSLVIDAARLTELAVLNAIVGRGYNSKYTNRYDAFNEVLGILCDTNTVLVLKSISQSKISHKGSFARSLIKILDDAHVHHRANHGDIVFIDYGSFLEKHGEHIATYLNVYGCSPYQEV